jgi:hypothetical protein
VATTRRGLVLAAAVALVLPAGTQASRAFGRGARSRAAADAAMELATARLPSHASKVRSDQSVRGVLGSPPRFRGVQARYVVDDYRFWRAPGKPGAVAAWIQHHAPSRNTGVGTAGRSPWFVEFGFRDQRGVTDRFLMVTVAAAKGGGSALRVEGVAVWLPRRRDRS